MQPLKVIFPCQNTLSYCAEATLCKRFVGDPEYKQCTAIKTLIVFDNLNF